MLYDVVVIDECGDEAVYSSLMSEDAAYERAEEVRELCPEFRSVWVEPNARMVAEQRYNERMFNDEEDMW